MKIQVILQDIDLLEVGNSIVMCGAIFTKHIPGQAPSLYLVPFPGAEEEVFEGAQMFLPLTTEEWERFLHQSDVLDVRGPGKAILRKSQRQIDRQVQWQAWRRDGFLCRYCGTDGPLTVDHVIRWENGGASVLQNLVSACPKCNRLRGDMEYEEWLRSAIYRNRSREVLPHFQLANQDLLAILDRLRAIETKPRSR